MKNSVENQLRKILENYEITFEDYRWLSDKVLWLYAHLRQEGFKNPVISKRQKVVKHKTRNYFYEELIIKTNKDDKKISMLIKKQRYSSTTLD